MPEQLELQQLVETDGSRLEDAERGDGGGTIVVVSRCRPCPYLGLLLATLSSLFFSLCSVIVKWLVDVHPMELAACRFVGVLLPAIPIVLWRKEAPFPRGKRIMLLLRSFVGTTGLMLSFYAFRHMPLADASVNLLTLVI
jgi:drug/metabolite transporter (DMT)-like permease